MNKNKYMVDEVRFNYYPGSSDGQYCERYERRILQIDSVVSIKETVSESGEIIYDVVYENGQIERIFHPHWSHLTPAT